MKFHATWFHPNDATLMVVGDTTMAEIKPKLEKLFAGWKPGERAHQEFAKVQLQPKPAVYLIDRPGALQSVIMAGRHRAAANNPQEIAIAAMNDILGGTFGARINMNLREDKHWAYGAFSPFCRRARASVRS